MRDQIENTILAQTAAWVLAGRIAKARDVGDGHCEEFAEDLIDRLPPDVGIDLVYGEDWWARVTLEDGGSCADEAEPFFADIPRLRAEGAPLPSDIPDEALGHLIGQATHVWISWDGWHFDASAPDGRRHWLEMPFFADQIEGMRKDLLTRAR